MKSRSPSPIAALAILAALALPAPSAAQQSDWRLQIIPRVGYLTPVGELVDATSRVDGSTIRSLRVEIEGATTAGISFAIENEALGLGLRGTVDRTVGGSTSVLARSARQPDLGINPIVDRSEHDLSTAVTEAGVELLLPTRLEIAGVAPYVSAGVGLRQYQFQEPPEEGEAWVPFPGGGTVVDVLVGGGIDFRLLGRDLDLAVYDAVSKYRGEEAHHVRVSLGVPLRLSF